MNISTAPVAAPRLTTDQKLDRFAEAVCSGKSFSEAERQSLADGLCGRVIRGKTEADFSTLTDNPDRRIVFTFGPDALAQMPGRSGVDILTTLVGATSQHIRDKYGPDANGNPKHMCRLVVFPESEGAFVATWKNVCQVAAAAYPQHAQAFEDARRVLQEHEFGKFQIAFKTVHGNTYKEVEMAGKEHPKYMTEERFARSERSPLDVRSFLYFSLAVRELFSGDGRTRSEDGSVGPLEYVIPNVPVANLHHRMISLNVDTSRLPEK